MKHIIYKITDKFNAICSCDSLWERKKDTENFFFLSQEKLYFPSLATDRLSDGFKSNFYICEQKFWQFLHTLYYKQ